MKIEINGVSYNAIPVIENKIMQIAFETPGSFSELVEALTVETGDNIDQYDDNDNLVGRYYAYGLCSLELNDGRAVAKYAVSQLGINSEEAITGDVDDVVEAVMELAAIIDENGEAYDALNETVDNHTGILTRIDSLYNDLADRVARLENK